MPITWRTSTRGDVGSTTPFSVTEPTGAAQNDILILTVYSYSSATYADCNTPTGWTLVNTQRWFSGSDYSEVRTFWIRRGASAPSLSVTRSFSAYAEWSVDCAVGVRTTGDPYSNQTQTTPASRAAPNPGAVTTAAGETVWCLGYSESSAGGGGWTAPSGYTLRNPGAVSYNMTTASKDISSGSSEDPGAFSGPTASNICAEATWSLVAAGGGGITGDATITLGNVTVSATGALEIVGTTNQTLAAVGLAATGSLTINADAGITLDSVGISADGTVSSGAPVVADVAVTLGGIGLTADGTAGWSVSFIWLDATAEDGYRFKRGTSSGVYDWSVDLPADTTGYTLTGLVVGTTYYVRLYPLIAGVEQTPYDEIVFTVGAVEAAVNTTLDGIGLTATGSFGINAAAGISLGAVTLSADGTVIGGSIADVAITLANVTVSADGTVVGGAPVTADAAITLGGVTLTSGGNPEIIGTASITFDVLTVASTISSEITGAVNITLASATLAADGTVIPSGEVTANATIVLMDITAASVGEVQSSFIPAGGAFPRWWLAKYFKHIYREYHR